MQVLAKQKETISSQQAATPAEADAATAKLLLWSLTPKAKPKSNRKRTPSTPPYPQQIPKPKPKSASASATATGQSDSPKIATQSAVSACFCMFPPCQPRLHATHPPPATNTPCPIPFLHMNIVKATRFPHFPQFLFRFCVL